MARSLVVEILSDASKFDKGIDKAERSVKGFEGSTKKADTTTAKFTGRVDAAAIALKGIVAAAAGAAILKFGADSLKAASDLSESANAVEQTFESAADTVLGFAKTAASSVGLSAAAFQQLATPLGALFRNFGFDAQDAADSTIELTQRAADLASVFNVDVSEALGAIQAALRGEGDPIERFGANVSAARVEAFALAEGLAATKGEIDDQIKVQARLGLILQDTARFAGDFADTSDGAANQLRILKARVTDLQAEIGQDLLGPAAISLRVFGDSLTTVRKFTNALTNLFNEQERTAGEATIAIDKLQLAIGDLTSNSLASFVTLIKDISSEYEGVAEETSEFRDESNELADDLEITAEILEEFADAAGLTADDIDNLLNKSVEELAETFGLPQEQIPALISLLEDLREELTNQRGIDAYAERYRQLAGFYKITGDGARDAAAGNEELAASFLSVLQARKELVSPLFAAAQAQKRLADARQELADARGSDDVDEIARAELDVIAAQADAQISTEEFARTFEDSFQAAIDISGGLREDLLQTLAVLGLLNDLTPVDILKVALGQSSLGAIAPNPANDPRNFPRSDRQFVPTSSAGSPIVMNNSFSIDGSNPRFAQEAVRELDEQLQRYRRGNA